MCDRWHNRSLQSVSLPEEVKCVFCGGKTANITPRTRAGGEKVKRFQCKECGRYFQETYINGYVMGIDSAVRNDYTVVEV